MIIFPIIPIWLMGILCIILLIMRRKNKYACNKGYNFEFFEDVINIVE